MNPQFTPHRGQRGFVTVFLIGLLPLLLALATFLFLFSQLLILKQEAQHSCRHHLLRAQKSMIVPLEQLLRLNPKAKTLIAKKRVAQGQIALAIATANPVLGARAGRRLQVALREQRRLAALQKTLIARATAGALSESLSLQQKWHSKVRRRRTLLTPFVDITSNHITLPRPRLAVRKSNPRERASPYELAQPFEDKQKMTARWHLGLRLGTFQSFSFNRRAQQVLEGRCSATLRKLKTKWQPVLNEVRY